MHIGRDVGHARRRTVGAVLHVAAQGPGLQQQCRAHLRAVPDRRPPFKRDFKPVPTGIARMLRFVLSQHRAARGLAPALPQRSLNIVRNGDAVAQELIQTRCHRGARSRACCAFPKRWPRASAASTSISTAAAGRPAWRATASRSLRGSRCWPGRGCLPFRRRRRCRADEVRKRAGSWFDPELVEAFERRRRRRGLLGDARARRYSSSRAGARAGAARIALDDDYLDDIAAAFGEVVDSKSPFTSRPQQRVALLHRPDRRRPAAVGRTRAAGSARRVAARRRQAGRQQRDARQGRRARRRRMGRREPACEYTEPILAASAPFSTWPAWRPHTMSGSTAAAIRAA